MRYSILRLIERSRFQLTMHSSPNLSDTISQLEADNAQVLSRPVVIGFYGVSVLFNLCLIAQVLTVGLAYFQDPVWWQTHIWLVRSYSGLSLILLAWVYWIPFPPRIRSLTASFPLLLGLQFLTIHVQTPLPFSLAVVHPLIGFSLFSASTTLVHRVWRIVSPGKNMSA